MSEERTEEPTAAVATEAPPEAQQVPSAGAAVPTGGPNGDGSPPEAPAPPPATPPSNGTTRTAPAPAAPAGGAALSEADEFARSMAAGTTVPSLKEGDVVRGVVV